MTATAPDVQQAEPQRPHLRRDIGRVGLLFTGVGSIIGSGWLFGVMNAAQLAGPAAIFSWLIAAFMIMLIGLIYAELGTMFPVSGGVVRLPHYAFGGFASYLMGWITCACRAHGSGKSSRPPRTTRSPWPARTGRMSGGPAGGEAGRAGREAGRAGREAGRWSQPG